MKKILLIVLILLFSVKIFGKDIGDVQSAYAKKGNIFFSLDKKNYTQITQSGKDRSPILSPDNKLIAFIRKSDTLVPEHCAVTDEPTDKHADQIWIYDIAAKKERLLVANDFSCDKPENMIIYIYDLHFTSDSNQLYFLTPAWTTSNALHVVNINATPAQHFVIPALVFDIVPKGQYKDNLIVQQHRYFIGGGSFDWFWLFTPESKEVGPLGPEVRKDQIEFLQEEKS